MSSLREPTPRPPVHDAHIHDPRSREGVDVKALENDLRLRVSGEVRFDNAARGLYAYDASNYTQPPIGIVIPKSADDVVGTVEICRKYRAPVLSRGGRHEPQRLDSEHCCRRRHVEIFQPRARGQRQRTLGARGARRDSR